VPADVLAPLSEDIKKTRTRANVGVSENCG
jgi:hypothetical protein